MSAAVLGGWYSFVVVMLGGRYVCDGGNHALRVVCDGFNTVKTLAGSGSGGFLDGMLNVQHTLLRVFSHLAYVYISTIPLRDHILFPLTHLRRWRALSAAHAKQRRPAPLFLHSRAFSHYR